MNSDTTPADESVGPTCPHCLEPVSEDTGIEGPHGNLWHQSCLDGWREEEPVPVSFYRSYCMFCDTDNCEHARVQR